MKRKDKSSMKGFTLIELLVVVIIIGILAAIALPNFIGVQSKAREASVKANMRTTQIATESFATDNGGTYPTAVGLQLESYFPGGSNDGSAAGNPSVNPFTNVGSWSDYIAFACTNVAKERTTYPGAASGTPGQICYSNGDTSPAINSYAIEGIGTSNKAIAGQGASTTLVLSNE